MGKRSTRRFLRGLCCEPLEPRQLLAADVLISEIMAANDGVVADDDGDYSDWIEIYNAGPDDAELGQYHLTDDADELSKWDFPDQTLAAGSFLLVFASDKDRAAPGEPPHTNFKLTTDGEYLALTRDDPLPGQPSHIVSEFAPEFPRQFTDMSYGRAQEVTRTELISATDPARVIFPRNSSLGSLWTSLEFNDSLWNGATAAIGYQQTVPGFTVRDVKATSPLLNLSDLYINGQYWGLFQTQERAEANFAATTLAAIPRTTT